MNPRAGRDDRLPSREGGRSLSDPLRVSRIVRVFEANYRCYGARKIWRQLHREGIVVARCTVTDAVRASDWSAPRSAFAGFRFSAEVIMVAMRFIWVWRSIPLLADASAFVG
jgi:transposase InsO family protein